MCSGSAALAPDPVGNAVRLVLAVVVRPLVMAIAAVDRVEVVDLARAFVLGAVANVVVLPGRVPPGPVHLTRFGAASSPTTPAPPSPRRRSGTSSDPGVGDRAERP